MIAEAPAQRREVSYGLHPLVAGFPQGRPGQVAVQRLQQQGGPHVVGLPQGRRLHALFGVTGKTPDHLTGQDVFAWAYGVGLSGRAPSANTVGSRIACVSSFYRFLIRMGLFHANPCDALERPKATPSTPRGLSAEEVQRLLAVMPRTRVGLRGRAIMLALILTGRRRAEVMALTPGTSPGRGMLWFWLVAAEAEDEDGDDDDDEFEDGEDEWPIMKALMTFTHQTGHALNGWWGEAVFSR